jgi:hypothetical protein
MTEMDNWSWFLSFRSGYALKGLVPSRLASLTLDCTLTLAIFQEMGTSVPCFLF